MQGFHHILLDIYKYLMMQSSMWQMVCTRTVEELNLDRPEGSAGRGRGQIPHDDAPPPPPPLVSLEQLLATQNDQMRRLVENDERHGTSTSNPDTKKEILHTRTFWPLTLRSLPMRSTP
jgi:hypothetical protein